MHMGLFRVLAIGLVMIMVGFFGALEAEDKVLVRKPSSLAPLQKSSKTDTLPVPSTKLLEPQTRTVLPNPWRLGEPKDFNLLAEPPSFDTNGLATQKQYRTF